MTMTNQCHSPRVGVLNRDLAARWGWRARWGLIVREGFYEDILSGVIEKGFHA